MILKIGDEGPAVGLLQQQLVEAGYDVEASELATARFSESTYHALRAFQASHIDPLTGHALAEDGLVGPASLRALQRPSSAGDTRPVYTVSGWRCEPSAARAEVRPVIDAALGELSRPVVEDPDGSNRGRWVDRYGGDGQPWCCYFLSYCYAHAEPPPFSTIASAYKLATWARAHNRVLPATEAALPGDFFVILRAFYHGHAGLIVGAYGDGGLITIEGNASNAVRGLTRRRETVAMIVRPIPLR